MYSVNIRIKRQNTVSNDKQSILEGGGMQCHRGGLNHNLIKEIFVLVARLQIAHFGLIAIRFDNEPVKLYLVNTTDRFLVSANFLDLEEAMRRTERKQSSRQSQVRYNSDMRYLLRTRNVNRNWNS